VRFAARVSCVLLSVSIAACTPLRQFHRFFLTSCPEDGPAREEELEIVLAPIELSEYLAELRAAASGLSVRPLVEVAHGDRTWPIQHIRRPAPDESRRLLVVAGMHGNEVAGALAAPEILEDLRAHQAVYEGVDLHLVAPVNPVGVGHGSRYQGDGCDINRDFEAFETLEAQALRELIEEVEPDLSLSLHEGPHAGFFVIATRSTPASLAPALARELASAGVELAVESNLGTGLDVPGVMREGWGHTMAKKLLGIDSLGAYAHERSIPLLTTEGPWGDPDIPDGVRAQVLAVRAAARWLSEAHPRAP